MLGFNSGKYDLNAVKEFLMPYLVNNEPMCNNMCIKRFSISHIIWLLTLVMLSSSGLMMFLKKKGSFHYEYLTSIEKLQETTLPPHKAFYSLLTRKNISAAEYTCCQ